MLGGMEGFNNRFVSPLVDKAGKWFSKKEDRAAIEKQSHVEAIDRFFRQKISENGVGAHNISENIYYKPYAAGISPHQFEQAIEGLTHASSKDKALELLETMIDKATSLDPRWPDIQEMETLRKTIHDLSLGEISKNWPHSFDEPHSAKK